MQFVTRTKSLMNFPCFARRFVIQGGQYLWPGWVVLYICSLLTLTDTSKATPKTTHYNQIQIANYTISTHTCRRAFSEGWLRQLFQHPAFAARVFVASPGLYITVSILSRCGQNVKFCSSRQPGACLALAQHSHV